MITELEKRVYVDDGGVFGWVRRWVKRGKIVSVGEHVSDWGSDRFTVKVPQEGYNLNVQQGYRISGQIFAEYEHNLLTQGRVHGATGGSVRLESGWHFSLRKLLARRRKVRTTPK